MAHPHTPLVLLILVCSLWLSDGKTYFTHLGTKCIEDCKLDDGVYKCKTIDKDGKYQTMNCSPQENMDSQGRPCTDPSVCENNKEDYCVCRSASWGYCGTVKTELNHYGSTYGLVCYDNCDKRNKDYYWCNTAKGWDFCSPSENTDYMNRPCKEDSPCGYHGENYKWCWLKGGSWGLCGEVMTNENHYGSQYGVLCYDCCEQTAQDYHWCYTAQGWDYCSPSENTDHKKRQCDEDSPCGKQGYGYNWCWTSDHSKYDYRGHIKSDKCTHSNLWDTATQGTGTQKDRKLIRTCYDKGNKKITTFTAKPAPGNITEGGQWRNEAEKLIGQWKNEYLEDQTSSILHHSDNLQIVMLGTIIRNNQLYYNLLIQVNKKRIRGESTTVSQIIVPDGIPDRYIRRAFLESFKHQAQVFVEVMANQNQSLELEMSKP
ncbi:uncharacterized protein [Chanodichthys erythropterus]|uniref:uncharacterized protein n=1 Tax=Chanodichthys erythropterus TaxID=933992 RepID=UPI00351F6535